MAADPGFDAEPAAAYEGAEEGGDVGPADAEGGASEDGEGDAVFGARDGGEDEGDEEDKVGGDDGGDSLPPGHAEVNEASGEVVGGDANDEADPEAGEVESGGCAIGLRDRGEVGDRGGGGFGEGRGGEVEVKRVRREFERLEEGLLVGKRRGEAAAEEAAVGMVELGVVVEVETVRFHGWKRF